MNYIVDDIGTVINAMNLKYFSEDPCQYIFGHEQEITNRLLKQQMNPELRDQRYPLIALFLDISKPIVNGVTNYKLNLVIAAQTKVDYIAPQRYQDGKPFKSVLYPLYEAFFQALSDSGLFMWPAVTDKPEHEAIDRPFWGTSKTNERGDQKNTANIFNDTLDAIQIKNLKINQKLKNC